MPVLWHESPVSAGGHLCPDAAQPVATAPRRSGHTASPNTRGGRQSQPPSETLLIQRGEEDRRERFIRHEKIFDLERLVHRQMRPGVRGMAENAGDSGQRLKSFVIAEQDSNRPMLGVTVHARASLLQVLRRRKLIRKSSTHR